MFLLPWAVWSSAAESALADAYCFAGGPVPERRRVLGRGVARFRVVCLGSPKVRKLRGNDGRDVHMYRDSSITQLLDLRRRFKVGYDVMVTCFVMALLWAVLWNLLLSGVVFSVLVLCILLLLMTCCVSRRVVWVGFMRLLVFFR